jgi:hypothetical protein
LPHGLGRLPDQDDLCHPVRLGLGLLELGQVESLPTLLEQLARPPQGPQRVLVGFALPSRRSVPLLLHQPGPAPAGHEQQQQGRR